MNDGSRHGEVIVRANTVGTGLFVVAASTSAIVFSTSAQWFGAITSISLFAVGCGVFLWAFYNAVQRSRAEQLAVTELFLLLGDPTPRRVRRIMLLLLFVQCATAMVTALARPNTADGSPGSSLALGFLVPMFGLGMNGLWAAFHGDFPRRGDAPRADASSSGHDGRTSTTPIDKNGPYG